MNLDISTDTLAVIAGLGLIVFHAAMILVWRKKTGAMWIMLLLASAAFAAVNLPSAMLRSALESVSDFVLEGSFAGQHSVLYFWVLILTGGSSTKRRHKVGNFSI